MGGAQGLLQGELRVCHGLRAADADSDSQKEWRAAPRLFKGTGRRDGRPTSGRKLLEGRGRNPHNMTGIAGI